MEKDKKAIQEIANELLEKLQIKAQTQIKELDGVYYLNIQTNEEGLLIGYHGTTLNSFQIILQTLVFRKLLKWTKIIVNIGDYRQKREEVLKNLALNSARQVIETQQPVVLPFLPPAERRIIHLTLANHPQVISESQGVGRNRRITIKVKNK